MNDRHGSEYPSWVYYPSRSRPPAWVETFVSIVRDHRDAIESAKVKGLTSDSVLSHMSTGLATAGYSVETGKKAGDRVRRPVVFGEQGKPRVSNEVDAVHDELGVVVEVEAS